MSNPPSDRPIAQPRRRLNRTTSANSVGSVGSTPGSTSPMNQFGFGSPSSMTAAKPPVQPTFGFGSPATTANPSPFSTQPVQSGFGSPMTNPPATSTTPSTGFGGFGNAQGSLFSGFGKPSQPAKNDDYNDSNMDSDEQPAAPPSFSGFGASKPQTSTPAPLFSLAPSTVSTEQTKPAPAFAGFSFGKQAPSTAPTSKPTESVFGGFKSTNTDKPAETTPTKPLTGFSFGSLNTPSTTAAPSISFGTSKATPDKAFAAFSALSNPTPSSFTGLGQAIPSATISEIPSSESGDDDDNEPTTSTNSKAVPLITPTSAFSFNKPSVKPAGETSAKEDKSNEKPSAISFASFASMKKSEIPPTFAGLKSASEVSSPSSVIANTSSPAPILEVINSEKEDTVAESTTSTTAEKAAEKQAAPSLFQSKSSFRSASSDTSTQAVAVVEAEASPSLFGSATKTSDKSVEAKKATSGLVSFGNDFSITPSQTGSSLFGKPAEKPDTVVIDDESADESAKKDDKKPSFSFGSIPSASSSSDKSMSPFSFNQPASTSDKPSPFSFSKPPTDSAPAAAAAKPFSFGSSTATPVKEKPEASKPSPFSINTPAPTDDKPSPFSFNSPASGTTAKPATFSFNSPASGSTDKPATFSFSSAVVAASSNSSHKKRDRDADDDGDQGQSNKKTLTSDPKPKSATASGSTPAFSFNTGKDSASPFKFGATPATKPAEGLKESTVVPTFTFGTPAPAPAPVPAPEKKDSAAPVFTFGSSATTENTNKKETPKTFSFDSPVTSSATPKKNFTFGTPPVADAATTDSSKGKSAADASKPTTFSFGSAASTPSLEEKSNSDDVASKADGSTLIHGKSPLSKTTSSTTKDASTEDAEGDKIKSLTNLGKKVSFGLPEAASPFGASTPKPSEPASASLAFSKIKDTSEIAKPATLNLLPSTKKDTSSSGTSYQTTLKSSITDINQITYKTRFWELPDDARNELALLAHFITSQTDKKDKIDQEFGSYFGSSLKEVHTNASAINNDAIILGQQLEVQSKSIDDLIVLNKEQRLNATSASNIQQQESKNWRIRGATENWNFFNNAISSMEERFRHLSATVDSVEEAVVGLQSTVQFSPQYVGSMLNQQRQTYMSLAGRVADIHQEADRVVKRRKLTK